MLPQLPKEREDWTPDLIAEHCKVPVRTVRYHCASAFRGHRGHWQLNWEQAQKVVNRMFTYGWRKKIKVAVKLSGAEHNSKKVR